VSVDEGVLLETSQNVDETVDVTASLTNHIVTPPSEPNFRIRKIGDGDVLYGTVVYTTKNSVVHYECYEEDSIIKFEKPDFVLYYFTEWSSLDLETWEKEGYDANFSEELNRAQRRASSRFHIEKSSENFSVVILY